jgi:hypothetical protein
MSFGRIPLLSSRFLIPLAFGAVFATTHSARAARPRPPTESKSLHEVATLPSGGIVLDPPFLLPISYGTLTLTGSAAGMPPIDNPPIGIIRIFPFQTGTVDLVALLRGGSFSGSIAVSVTGYSPGAYTVSAVTESSSNTVVLGTLTVTSGSFPVLSGTNPVAIPQFGLPIWSWSSGSAKFGAKKAPFPAGFSPFDVATISISDSNDNVVSTATLTPVPDGFYTALSPVAPGTSAPGATGYALVHAATPPVFLPLTLNTGALHPMASAAVLPDSGSSATTTTINSGSLSLTSGATLVISGNGSNPGAIAVGGTLTLSGNTIVGGGATLTSNPILLSGSTPILVGLPPFVPFDPPTGRIVIRAQGLPASTRLTYAADGTDLGKTTTDSAGNLTVYAAQGGKGKLPSTLDLFSITTLTVHDAAGNVYLSAGF